MILTDGTWALMWSKVEICLSCAYISQTFSSYFQVVPCLVWSETLQTECFIEIFLLVSCVLQYFCPDKPYYRTCCGSVCFIAVEWSIRDLRKRSSLTPRAPVWEMKRVIQQCDFCFLTSVLLLRHFRADVSYDLRIPRSKTAAFSPLPPAFLKYHRLLLQTYRKSQECHSLRTDWWCFGSGGLKNVYLVLF